MDVVDAARCGSSLEARFSEALRLLFVRDDLGDAAEMESVARQIARFSPRSAQVRNILDESGLRRRWNRVLGVSRASVLAQWIRPHVVAPVVDILAGDGTVAAELVRCGIDDVLATERLGAYATWNAPVALIPHGQPLPGRIKTALLCAVLHHEPDPLELLEYARATGATRWVIVENCIDDNFDADLHLTID